MIELEIERKFLVERLPQDIHSWPCVELQQGYLAIDDSGREVRLRMKGDQYFLTVKHGTGLQRAECEVEISRRQFEQLWPLTLAQRIEKTRYTISTDSKLTIELDIYHGELTGLITAEVEFTCVADSKLFREPEWLGREITDDRRFKNQQLALHGVPSG